MSVNEDNVGKNGREKEYFETGKKPKIFLSDPHANQQQICHKKVRF